MRCRTVKKGTYILQDQMRSIASFAAVLVVVAGCATCPAALPVTLGNGAVVTANANSGTATLRSSVWTFYANSPVAPLAIFGDVLPIDVGMLFRSDFGAQGELVQVFDNVRLAPETLGSQLILDNAIRPAARPPLSYVAESYAAQDGSSIGLTTCGKLFVGPLEIIDARIEFSGTDNDVLGRADGTLKIVTTVNPLVGWLIPAISSGTIELDGFALRENRSAPNVPAVPFLPLLGLGSLP